MSLAPNTGSVELTAYRAHVSRLLAKGERVDKRAFDTYRLPSIVREERFGDTAVAGSPDQGLPSPGYSVITNTSSTPNNSTLAAVMYTDAYGTCIQCTVQGLLGPPRPDQPSAGRLNIHVEAPFVEHMSGGAKGENYRSFQYMVTNDSADLPLRQLEGYVGTVLDGCFDLKQLSIYEGEACWVLNVNVLLLSFDGGLRAGSLHAALAALHQLHLPRTRLPNGDVIEGRQVQLSCMPVACTFGFLAGAQVRLVTDTTAIEEHILDGLITVAVDERSGIVGVHHTGRCPLLPQALTAAVEQWIAASGELRKSLYGMGNPHRSRRDKMDLGAFDFDNYQLARQLHMLPELYKVFASQVMCYPLFYDSLLPTVRQLARVILLSLHRRFNASAGVAGGLPLVRRYQVDSMRLILSFLEFTDHQVDRVSIMSRCVTATPLTHLELSPQQRAAALTLSSSLGATPSSLTPQLTGSTAVAMAPPALSMPRAVEEASSGTASGNASLTATPVHRPAASTAGAVQDTMSKALFFLRPICATAHGDTSTLHAGATTHLYTRMVHPEQLNEESLNTYFGRYGQVDVTPVQRTPLQQYEQYLGDAVTAALHQLFPSTEVGDTLYVQDFIITVDSPQNALHAVRNAYYKELICIAFHDAAASGGMNTHCLADVNNWMRRHAFVWRLRADPRVIATGTSIGAVEGANRAAAAERQRKRARALCRRQERQRKRRSVLGIAAGELSEGVAESFTPSSYGKAARQTADSTDSSSGSDFSSSSSTSEGDSEEDDQGGFVPDVLLDGFPYWTTEDQLKVLLQEYGSVTELRLSVDDLSGAFTGCVLVRMASVQEALILSRALHNTLYRGYCLTSGVVNERLEVVALEDGQEVRRPSAPDQIPPDVTLNERVWV